LTYNIDTDKVVEYITPRTKAVIVVHLFGLMTPVEKLEPLLKDKGIHLIEDCAQSFGAWRKIDGKIRRCGTIGTFGCFSFYPTKNLGGYGDGGLVTTNLSSLAERIKRLRAHGCSGEYIHEELGMNSRLDAIQAAVLRCRLRHVDDWNRKRRIIAERYRLLFNVYKISEFVKAPSEDEGSYHVYHQYVLSAVKEETICRNILMRTELALGSTILCRCIYSRCLNILTTEGVIFRKRET